MIRPVLSAACLLAAVFASGAGMLGGRQTVETEHPTRALRRFHAAASEADFKTYSAMWTDESVFLGTDATERWAGREFMDFARPYFEQGKGWTYRPTVQNVSTAGDGLVFFDELLDHDKFGTCRGSGVLKRVGGDWKVLQYNLSIPIPNERAVEVVAIIRGGGDEPSPKR